jgi:DNA-binding LytR/AlgR family response regulator
MFRVALCGLKNSEHQVKEKISTYLKGTAIEYSVALFENIEELFSSDNYYHLYFIHIDMQSHCESELLTYIKGQNSLSSRKVFNFITYVEDPISNANCDTIFDCIKRYLEYDSMYLSIEFLTTKGLTSIALSKIVLFEYCDRKIRIKTKTSEYFCEDTLQNVFSLVSGYAFSSPHKSFIVNLKHIADISGYDITMSDGSLVPLSQKRSHTFRKAYKTYIEERNAKVSKKAIKAK